jgi:hypothetical protein
MCKKPRSARSDDSMYSWTPSILEYQLAYSLSRSREPEVPASRKREDPVPRIMPREAPAAT